MENDNNPISIKFDDKCENNFYAQSKRYRNVRRDIEDIFEQIESGSLIGDYYRFVSLHFILIS